MKAVDDWDPAFLDSLTDFEFDQSASGDMLYDLNQDPLGDYEKQVNDTMDTSLTGNSTSSSSSGTREPPARATFTLEDIQDNGGAVCFGWISHPGTKTWRRDVDDISRNQENYPIWTDDIATQVRKGLRLKGISEFFVPASGVNPIKRDIKRKSSSEDGSKDNENNDSNPKLWHSATNEEFMIRTRQRFNDARKNTNKPKRQRATHPKTNNRIPCYRINEQSVCFEWNRHPGTAKWLEVVQQVSDNETFFSEWDDTISGRVKKVLEKESYGPFLVFTSVNDDPCTSIHHGLWVHATDKEFDAITRLQFLRNRRQLKDVPTGQIHSSGTPPRGGGPNGRPGSPKDSANNDRKPPEGDESHQTASVPHTFFGHGFGAGHRGRQRRLASVDTDFSDLTSSDHEGDNNASVKSSNVNEENDDGNAQIIKKIKKRSMDLSSASRTNEAAKKDSSGVKTITTNKIASVGLNSETFTTTSSSSVAVTPIHTAAKRNTNYDWFYWLAPAFIGLALCSPIGPVYFGAPAYASLRSQQAGLEQHGQRNLATGERIVGGTQAYIGQFPHYEGERDLATGERIVGGTQASIGQFPYYAQWWGNPEGTTTSVNICGASLIHSDILLTAAHCGDIANNVRVVVGAYYDLSNSVGISRTVTNRAIHPGYSGSPSWNNDLLVLKLNSPVSTTPVSLNSDPSSPYNNERLTITGLGRTSESASGGAGVLMTVNVNAVDPTTCYNKYLNNNPTSRLNATLHLCAGVSGGGKGQYQGDSGGPVLNSQGALVGVVSFGVECDRANYPGVTSRVSGNINWIRLQVCALSSNPPSDCFSSPTPPPVTQ